MNDKFKPNLSQLNEWLKAGNTGVRVECRGSRLSLVATVDRKQRRFATGLMLNLAGLAEAKKQALKLSADIAAGTVDKTEAPARQVEALTVGAAIALFKADWDSRYSGVKRSVTWAKDYNAVFSRLPLDATLTADLLKERRWN
jgi:hypothetical protein